MRCTTCRERPERDGVECRARLSRLSGIVPYSVGGSRKISESDRCIERLIDSRTASRELQLNSEYAPGIPTSETIILTLVPTRDLFCKTRSHSLSTFLR